MSRAEWHNWKAPDRRPVTDMYPIFGCRPFGANTTCGDIHHRDIPTGDAACCAVCSQSGLDDRRELRVTTADELRTRNWKPKNGRDQWTVDATQIPAEQPTAYRPPETADRTTRRQRRATRWGRNSVPAVTVDPAVLQRAIDDRSATMMA